MRRILLQFLQRFSPPMLRSNTPDRPMVVRRQNWLLQETRFLFLTRKGPIEIILKPSLIIGIGFIGLVGLSVISATTLFVGFKSVEVVRNESITAAEASAPTEILDGSHAEPHEPKSIETEPLLAAVKPNQNPPLLDPVISGAVEPSVSVAMATVAGSRLPWPASSAATDSVSLPPIPAWTPPRQSATGDDNTEELPLGDRYAEPEGLIPVPPMARLPVDDVPDNPALATRFIQFPEITDIFKPEPPNAIEVIAVAPPAPPTLPGSEPGGLVPFTPDRNLPVVTEASRQYKLLRSMAREIRGIRTSLSEIGLPEAELPALGELNTFVERADFARLALAVEDHRSLLRKVPLKPPMLYFYITSNYGMRMHPVLKVRRFHHGIDLAGTWQETVHTPAPGTVIYAGREGSFGKVVKVRHAYGFVTTYAHLAKITVRVGEDVVSGTVVGKMGRTGRVDGAHLHYEIRLGDTSIDPSKFFAIGHRIGVGGELMLATDQP